MGAFAEKVRRKLFWNFTSLALSRRLAWTTTSELHGRRFRIPMLLGRGRSNVYMSDNWMLHLFERLLPQSGRIFLDVGANVGQTLLKLRSCRPELPWVGLEPNPLCVGYLGQLINANRFPNCTVVPIGLSTSPGLQTLEFYAADDSDSSASMVENFRPEQAVMRRTLIPALSYESLRAVVPPDNVAFVKIDVEGGEQEVVETIQPILQASRPPIQIEVLPVYAKDNLPRLERQRALEALFARCDYRIHRVKKSGAGDFAGLEPLGEIGVHGDVERSDYLVLPAERAGELAAAVG